MNTMSNGSETADSIAHKQTSSVEIPVPQDFLVPPPQRRYVRSFLFARRVNAPFAQVHLLARLLFVLCLSAAALRTINTLAPDLFGAILLWLVAVLILVLSGVSPRVARFYFLLTLPALVALFITWIVFNPVPGTVTFAQLPLYSGQLNIELALWQGVFLAIVALYFLWTRKLFLGIVLGILIAFALAHWVALPTLVLAQVRFFHPLTLLVSNRGLLVAGTKVIGYAAMIMVSIALVMTARDTELIGMLRQLHVHAAVIFFLSTVFRSLDLALADYETISQAQLARAVAARPRSFIRRLRDLASIAVPMVALMIRRSSEIGDALLARGYTLGKASSDFYEAAPWRVRDWGIAVVSLGFFYVAVGPHPIIAW